MITELLVVIQAPFGRLAIRVNNDIVCGIDFLTQRTKLRAARTNFSKQIIDELEHYFSDPEYQFSLPVQLSGTTFQKSVWRALQTIPSGTTCTYGELAARLDSSARAVGNACRANPVPVIVPCHRVVAASGIGGFSGSVKGRHIMTKQWLLAHESALCVQNVV